MKVKRGDRVRHPDWGIGAVIKKSAFRTVRVVFDLAPHLPRRVKLSEIEFAVDGVVESDSRREVIGTQPPTVALSRMNNRPASVPVRTPVTAPTSESACVQASPTTPISVLPAVTRREFSIRLGENDAWQTLEALRLGVVPARGIQDYTVARKRELASIDALLGEGDGCRVLWGDYGAGKTHLLEAAEQLALEQGFATSRITLDPRENALHHPLSLYQRIADSVRTLDQVTPGFEILFERLVESKEHYRPGGSEASRFFSPYLHVLRYGDAEDIGWVRDYVRGDNIGSEEVNEILTSLNWTGQRVLRMSNFRTYGRMYVHLVGTLACWCADAGLRGLVLLFDEVERVEALSSIDRPYAFEVLRHYAAVTMNRDDLAFDPESLYKGGHRVHRAIPLRFRDTQPLVSIFALTPLEEIRGQFAQLTSSGSYDVHLEPLDRGLLPELLERIAALYERAYPGCLVSREVRDTACQRIAEAYDGGHDSFRDAVRSAVFLYDADRLHGSGPWAG